MAKRVSAGWHVSASAGDHPRPALLGLNDTLPGVLSWLGSRDVARLRRVCRELRDCGESAAQAAVARRGGAFGPDSAERRAFQSRFAAAPKKHNIEPEPETADANGGVAVTSISLPDEPWLRAEPFSRQPWLEVLRDLEAHERELCFSVCCLGTVTNESRTSTFGIPQSLDGCVTAVCQSAPKAEKRFLTAPVDHPDSAAATTSHTSRLSEGIAARSALSSS
jgi:hypothetical protein